MKFERTKHQQLRGMEIVITHLTFEERIAQLRFYEFTVRWHSIWDLFYFFVDARYQDKFESLAPWYLRKLYFPIYDWNFRGYYYYFFSIAFFLNLRRTIRIVWFWPHRWLITHGYYEQKDPGQRVSWLWWNSLRKRK